MKRGIEDSIGAIIKISLINYEKISPFLNEIFLFISSTENSANFRSICIFILISTAKQISSSKNLLLKLANFSIPVFLSNFNSFDDPSLLSSPSSSSSLPSLLSSSSLHVCFFIYCFFIFFFYCQFIIYLFIYNIIILSY